MMSKTIFIGMILVGLLGCNENSAEQDTEVNKEAQVPKQEVPIKLQKHNEWNPFFNAYISSVSLTSIVDSVTIHDVILNKGNCKSFTKNAIPRTLKFGENVELAYGKCNLIKVDVETDKGSWSYTID